MGNGAYVIEAWHEGTVRYGPRVPTEKWSLRLRQKIVNFLEFCGEVSLELSVFALVLVLGPSRKYTKDVSSHLLRFVVAGWSERGRWVGALEVLNNLVRVTYDLWR